MPKPQPKRAPAKPQQSVKQIPTLAAHELPEPYSRLMTLGEGEFLEVYDSIAETLLAGDVAEAVEFLIGTATDVAWYAYVDIENYPFDKDPFAEEPRLSVPMHALCVLSCLGEAALPQAERLLPLFHSMDEGLSEEAGYFFAGLGEPALPMLRAHIQKEENDPNIRAGIAESLRIMAENDAHLKEPCIALLVEALTGEEHPEVTVYLITSLMDLKVDEAYPLIEAAFREGRVDETLLELSEVQEFFGLPVAAPVEPLDPLLLDAFDEDEECEEDEDAVDMETPLLETFEEQVKAHTPFVSPVKAGRNDLCPCGSGKKYKKCCGVGK